MFWFSALEKKGINGEKQLLQLENHWGLECFEWCFSLTMAKLPEQVQKIAAVLRNNPPYQQLDFPESFAKKRFR